MMNTVNGRARRVATFRHISVQLMEICARWTPLTAEMEAKVMFGRHIWDHAQIADGLGKRVFELRQPLHHSLAPVEAYGELLRQVAESATTSARIAALYEGLLPGLIGRYLAYVASTDPILDEPSVVLMQDAVRVLERHRVEAVELQSELGLRAVGSEIGMREQAIASLVAPPMAVSAA